MTPTFSSPLKLREFVDLIASVRDGQTTVSDAALKIDALGLTALGPLTTIRNELFSQDNEMAWCAYHVLRLSTTFSAFNRAELPNWLGGIPRDMKTPEMYTAASVAECVVYDALQKLKIDGCTREDVLRHFNKLCGSNPEIGCHIVRSLDRLSVLEMDPKFKDLAQAVPVSQEMKDASGSVKRFAPKFIERICRSLNPKEGTVTFPLAIPSYEGRPTEVTDKMLNALYHICAKAAKKEISIAQAANQWVGILQGTNKTEFLGAVDRTGIGQELYVRTWCEITQHSIVHQNRLNWFMAGLIPGDTEPYLSDWVRDHAAFESERQQEMAAGIQHDPKVSRVRLLQDTTGSKSVGKTPYHALRAIAEQRTDKPSEAEPWVALEVGDDGRFNLHVVTDLVGSTMKEMAGSYPRLYEISHYVSGMTTVIEVPGSSPEDAVARLKELRALSPKMGKDILPLEKTAWQVRLLPPALADKWYTTTSRIPEMRQLPVIYTEPRTTADYLAAIPRRGKSPKLVIIPSVNTGEECLAYVRSHGEQFEGLSDASEGAPWIFFKLTEADAKLSFMDYARQIEIRTPDFASFDGVSTLSASELQNRPQQIASVAPETAEQPKTAYSFRTRVLDTKDPSTGQRILAYQNSATPDEEGTRVRNYVIESDQYRISNLGVRMLIPAQGKLAAYADAVENMAQSIGAAEEIAPSFAHPWTVYEFEAGENLVPTPRHEVQTLMQFSPTAPKPQPTPEGSVRKTYVFEGSGWSRSQLDVCVPTNALKRLDAVRAMGEQITREVCNHLGSEAQPSFDHPCEVYEFEVGEPRTGKEPYAVFADFSTLVTHMKMGEEKYPQALTEKLSDPNAFTGGPHSTEGLELPSHPDEEEKGASTDDGLSLVERQESIIAAMRLKGEKFASLIPRLEAMIPQLRAFEETIARMKETTKAEEEKSSEESALQESNEETRSAGGTLDAKLSTPKGVRQPTIPEFCKELVQKVRDGKMSFDDAGLAINRLDPGPLRETLIWESLISGTVEDSWVGYYIAARSYIGRFARSAHLDGPRPLGDYHSAQKIAPYAASEFIVWEWLHQILGGEKTVDTVFGYLTTAGADNKHLAAFLANALQTAGDVEWEGKDTAQELLKRFEADGPRKTTNPPEVLPGLETEEDIREFLHRFDGREMTRTRGLVTGKSVTSNANTHNLQHLVREVVAGTLPMNQAVLRLGRSDSLYEMGAQAVSLGTVEEKQQYARTWFDLVEHELSPFRARLFMPALRNLVGHDFATEAFTNWAREYATDKDNAASQYALRFTQRRQYAAISPKGKRHVFRGGSMFNLCQKMIAADIGEEFDLWKIRDVTGDIDAQSRFLSGQEIKASEGWQGFHPALGLSVEQARERGYELTYSITDPRLKNDEDSRFKVESDSWEGVMQEAWEEFNPPTEDAVWVVYAKLRGDKMSLESLVTVVTGYDATEGWKSRDLSVKDLEHWSGSKATGSNVMPTKWDDELVRNTATEMCRRVALSEKGIVGVFDAVGALHTAASLPELYKRAVRREPTASEPWTVYGAVRNADGATARAQILTGFEPRTMADPLRPRWGDSSPEQKIADTGVLKVTHNVEGCSGTSSTAVMKLAAQMRIPSEGKPWVQTVSFQEEISGTVKARIVRNVWDVTVATNGEVASYRVGDWTWVGGIPSTELMEKITDQMGGVRIHFPARMDIQSYQSMSTTGNLYLVSVPRFKDGTYELHYNVLVRADSIEQSMLDFKGTQGYPIVATELLPWEATTWGSDELNVPAILADNTRAKLKNFGIPQTMPEAKPEPATQTPEPEKVKSGNGEVTIIRDYGAIAAGVKSTHFVRYVVIADKDGKGLQEFHAALDSPKFGTFDILKEVIRQGATYPSDQLPWEVYEGGREFDGALRELDFQELHKAGKLQALDVTRNLLRKIDIVGKTLYWEDKAKGFSIDEAFADLDITKQDIHQETAEAILRGVPIAAQSAKLGEPLPPITHRVRIHDEVKDGLQYAVTLWADVYGSAEPQLVSVMVEGLTTPEVVRKIQTTYFANINPRVCSVKEPWTVYRLGKATEESRASTVHEYDRNVEELVATHPGAYLVKGYRILNGIASMFLQLVDATRPQTAITNLLANLPTNSTQAFQVPSFTCPWAVYEVTFDEILAYRTGADMEFSKLYDPETDARREPVLLASNAEGLPEFAPTASSRQWRVFAETTNDGGFRSQQVVAPTAMGALAQALAEHEVNPNGFHRASSLHPWHVYSEEHGYGPSMTSILKRPAAVTFDGSGYLYGRSMGYLVGYYRPGPVGDPISEWVRVPGEDAEDARDNFREYVRKHTAETMPLCEPTKDYAWELYEFSNAEAAHFLQGRTMPNLALWGRKKRLTLPAALRVASIVGSLYGVTQMTPWADIAKATIKDDLKEIALRGGVKRIRTVLGDRLSAFWTAQQVTRRPGESDRSYNLRVQEHQQGVQGFLTTEAGQGLMAYIVGMVWTVASEYVEDDTIREYGDVVAREIRVQGGTDVLDAVLTDVVFPMVTVLKDETSKFKAQAVEATKSPTRVETAPKTLDAPAVTLNTSEDAEMEMARVPEDQQQQQHRNN